MPGDVKSVETIYDGFKVTKVDGTVISLTTADIPNNVIKNLHTPADYENWINNTWLPKLLSYVDQTDGLTYWYWYAKVHVISINPMNAVCMISVDPIPDNWYQG